MYEGVKGKTLTITGVYENSKDCDEDYDVDKSLFIFSRDMLEPVKDKQQTKLDNITRELISRTDKLAAAYMEIERKEKVIKKQQKTINRLDKEAQRYFDDMLELSYKLQSKEDLLKAIMKYVNNLGK